MKSRSFESHFEKKSSSLGSLHHPARCFSMQHLPHLNHHHFYHHHQQQQQQQLPRRFENHSSSVSSLATPLVSNPRLIATSFPHHPLDIVVEQSPAREEDFDLPPGATAKSVAQTMPLSQPKNNTDTYTDSQTHVENMLFQENPDIQAPLGNLDDNNKPIPGKPDIGPVMGNPSFEQSKMNSALESTELQFPYYLDRHQQQQQQQQQRFPSQDDLQQYLHQAEVDNYLRHHRELTQLRQDIENADPVVSAWPVSSHRLQAQPRSSGSLASHQSSGSQNSGVSQRQSSTGSLGRKEKSSGSMGRKETSSGSLKQHSFGSSQISEGKSGTGGQVHQQHQLSTGSVHQHSRSSQDSVDQSNPSISTAKRAVLQSSGKIDDAYSRQTALVLVCLVGFVDWSEGQYVFLFICLFRYLHSCSYFISLFYFSTPLFPFSRFSVGQSVCLSVLSLTIAFSQIPLTPLSVSLSLLPSFLSLSLSLSLSLPLPPYLSPSASLSLSLRGGGRVCDLSGRKREREREKIRKKSEQENERE